MFTSPLLKRIATVLAALHILLVAQIPMAQAAMIGTPEVVAEHQQQVDRQQLLTMLEDQDVQKSSSLWALSVTKWKSVSTV